MIRRKYNSNERGQVIVIVAICLVCFVGMVALVVDVGSIYQERRHVQTVADSAALAGAQDLPENRNKAIQTAIEYAGLNGVTITEGDISFSKTYLPPESLMFDTIRVNPTGINAELFFAPVLGINSATVNAAATAVAGGPLSMTGLMPWAIPMDEYPEGLEYGEKYDLKVGPNKKKEPGWFQLMAFDGPGGFVYGETILNGCETEIFLWDPPYDSLDGNKAGPTESKVKQRVEGHEDCTFDEVVGINDDSEYYVKKACPKIVYIPVIEEKPTPPDKVAVVIDFYVFFLEDVEEIDKNLFDVKGKFVEECMVVSSGEITGYSGGIKIIRLIE
ncbi:pilus assembly protein TadG-related protein [Actinomycetota bacterium]